MHNNVCGSSLNDGRNYNSSLENGFIMLIFLRETVMYKNNSEITQLTPSKLINLY